MRSATFIAAAFLIALSFWCGTNYGISKTTPDCSEYQQQIEILSTLNSSQEWYIADEKRKNAAFLEVIEMEMEK